MSEERVRFTIEASKPGSCMAALCREFGISRQTGYLWLHRYREGGAVAVVSDRSRRPYHSPQQASESIVEAVKEARGRRPDWGARKLMHVLQATHPELPSVSTTTLQRVLEREGLIDNRQRQQIALQRFERKEANELWQMDFKGPQGFNKGTGPLSILDDFSRYLIELRQLGANNGSNVKAAMQAIFEQCGLPEYLLIDHGTPWYDNMNPWGWTELTVWILRHGVRIVFSGIRHPQTQGKIERMHGALQRAVRKRKGDAGDQTWLDAFRQEYNYVRPHEGIGMVPPASRWQPSRRQFDADRGDWEYPSDWTVIRLSGEGQFRYNSKRWEVSAALRRQLVGLQVNGARILVYYCNMPVREIDLATGINSRLPGDPFRLLHS